MRMKGFLGSRVDLTVRDDGENPRDRSYTPHHYKSLVSPSLTRCQANAVEFATKVCYSFFYVDVTLQY